MLNSQSHQNLNSNDQLNYPSNSSITSSTNTTTTTNCNDFTTSIKTKKGLSYVIGERQTKENHILPITKIEFSSDLNQLFTCSRDGTVKCWSKDYDNNYNNNNNNIIIENDTISEFETCSDIDEKLLKLETSISSNYLNYNQQPKNEYKVIKSFNNHIDHINDLVLCENQNLITCSSDLSIKITNLNNNYVNNLNNVHQDYIKCLSYEKFKSNTLFSGSLDGKVVCWDLNTLKPTQIIENNRVSDYLPSSIYSLASNSNSNIVITGGPSNTINVFDLRANQDILVKKLIGHQDNIRCLAMNDKYILSGSSDTTIKLWDLRTFKVYKNFDIHDDPVWSLTCNENFTEFYTGDKSGRIVKTDLTNLFINQDLNEKFFSGDIFNKNEKTMIDEKLGISTIISKCNTPILSICKESNNETLWCSNYESLNQYIIPNTFNLSNYQYLRACSDYVNNRDNNIDVLINQDSVNSSNGQGGEDLNSDFYDLISHLSFETNNDNLSQIEKTFHNNFTITNNESEIKEDYLSMILNTNGGPSLEFINTYKDETCLQNLHEYLDLTPLEILLNPISKEQITQIPFNIKPSNKFDIVPKSVISKRFFNNKRQIMALYLNGDIKIWDILICKELKYFPYPKKSNSKILDLKEIEIRIKEMDEIFQKYQTFDTLNNWCEVEIKSGKLLVNIKETSLMNVEIYYDDLIKDYPFLSIENNERLGKYKNEVINSDDRFHLGIILLNSLFNGYTIFENSFDQLLREEIFKIKPKEIKDENESINSSIRRLKAFGRKSSRNNVTTLNQSNQSSPLHSTNTSVVDLSIDPSTPINEFLNITDDQLYKTINDYDDSVMKLLQVSKKIYLDRSTNPQPQNNSILNIDQINPYLNINTFKDCEFKYFPIIPFSQFPKDMLIIIFEHSPELGNIRDLYSFNLKDIDQLRNCNPNIKNNLIFDLRSVIPKWIGQPILFNRLAIKESPKITFQLIECDYSELPSNVKIGGKSQRKIKKLPMLESSIKLTSHNMLRVSKILYYLTDKFESNTKEMKDKKLKPTDWLVIECKGNELSNDLTLQTIKTKIWKSSSDIELRFRRKFDS
ncbi:unnamed protein product [Candida verbasci]|uniref:TEP-1 C-terminal beta-propeller domain-containing protein n=1 Tax=Candida verbasci TaxID=1227364 RepID=A0A9W4TV78_9ASCO|nr:unnamed protein product [Candida verbasci]